MNVHRINNLRARQGGGTPLADLAQGGEDLGAGVEELGLADGEVGGEAGGLEELVGGGAEFDFGPGGEAVLGEGGVGGGEFGVEDGCIEGEDALEAPFDGGELADEVVFEVVLGEEGAGDLVDHALEGGVVLVAEDEERAGVAAVFEGVHGGAALALGGFGAAAAAPLAVGIDWILHTTHLRGGIIGAESRNMRGGFGAGAGKWFGMREMGERKKVKSCVKLVGMGVSFRLCVWNVMWAKAGTERGEAVRGKLREPGFDVICLTEGTVGGNRRGDGGGPLNLGENPGSCGLLPEGGYVIDSDPDYGYRIIEGRRKVLLWSRRPWREVDRVGDPGMPGGRFVSGVTETPVGDVRFVGVCIPWDWAHVDTGRKDRARWEDHLRYLEGLGKYLGGFRVCEGSSPGMNAGGILVAGGTPVVIAGDFNQTIPRTRARVDVYEALMRALRGWDLATAGLGGIDHVALNGGLRALRVDRWEAEYAVGKPVSDHAGVTVDVGWGE